MSHYRHTTWEPSFARTETRPAVGVFPSNPDYGPANCTCCEEEFTMTSASQRVAERKYCKKDLCQIFKSRKLWKLPVEQQKKAKKLIAQQLKKGILNPKLDYHALASD